MLRKKIQKSKKNKKGFSLIEALVAIFIFSMAMAMISGTFSSFLRNFALAKRLQKDIENAQFAMSIMSKTIRTSALGDGNSQVNINNFPINTFDYSQSKCIQYNFVNVGGGYGKIQMSYTNDVSPTKFADCNFANLTAATDLTAGDIINQSVNGNSTNLKNNPVQYGYLTVELSIQEPGQKSTVPIQMSVSLRQ